MSRQSTAMGSGDGTSSGWPPSNLARALLLSRTRAKLLQWQELVELWEGLGWYPWLWALLAATCALVVVTPELPIALREPTIATVSGALVAGVGLTVLYVGILRFSVLGQTADLYIGLGFGCLGSTSLFLWMARLVVGHEGAAASWIYLNLLTHAFAALLFAAFFLGGQRAVPQGVRRAYGFRVLASVAAVLILGSGAIVAWRSVLPPATGPGALNQLASGTLLNGALPDQQLWLVVLNCLIGSVFIVASVIFAHRANYGADRHLDALALTTSLIAFAHVNAVIAPPVDPDYVSIGDACMLAGYILFLGGLVVRLGDELSDHVAREERLRLSRELHDGLAQHLGLLHLRLTMATAPTREADQRMRDLVTARRLTEVAILEARQAVMALRNESVWLDRFRQTVQNFVGEFALNHEIEATVAVSGERETVGADMQAEVLRILHEALSNAIRHGGATVVNMEIEAGTAALEIRVSDNGRGFDPERTSQRGVGLMSIRERIARRGGLLQFRSSPGDGASLNAWIPAPKG